MCEVIDMMVEEIVSDSSLAEKTYFYLIEGTNGGFTSGYFLLSDDNEVIYDGDVNSELFRKHLPKITELMRGKGILLIRVENGLLIEKFLTKDYNPELSSLDVFELLLFQKYNIKPHDKRKQMLDESIKAEKIKDTLVFACRLNDMEKIKALVQTSTKAQLNYPMLRAGTPLSLCIENDNTEAFILIADKGAKLTKNSLAFTPLEMAFNYSRRGIVNYIREKQPDVYKKEVVKSGFVIAHKCVDSLLLENILDLGCDINCEKKPFPPLHSFADYDNTIGIGFLLMHGAKIDGVNRYKQTALHRAIRANGKNAVKMLLENGARTDIKDYNGQTAFEVAENEPDKELIKLLAQYRS